MPNVLELANLELASLELASLNLANPESPVCEEAGESTLASSSLAALVERHARSVYPIALAVVRNPQDAEDYVCVRLEAGRSEKSRFF
jgi:hypothetical protein